MPRASALVLASVLLIAPVVLAPTAAASPAFESATPICVAWGHPQIVILNDPPYVRLDTEGSHKVCLVSELATAE